MRRLRPAEGTWLAGGLALLASAFLHWVRRGAGRTLRGYDLVDTLVALGRDVPGLSAARLTVLWYLVPAAGALSWVVFGTAGIEGRAARIVAAGTAVVTAATLAGFARLAGPADLGVGALVALLGAAALVVAVFSRRAVRTH